MEEVEEEEEEVEEKPVGKGKGKAVAKKAAPVPKATKGGKGKKAAVVVVEEEEEEEDEEMVDDAEEVLGDIEEEDKVVSLSLSIESCEGRGFVPSSSRGEADFLSTCLVPRSLPTDVRSSRSRSPDQNPLLLRQNTLPNRLRFLLQSQTSSGPPTTFEPSLLRQPQTSPFILLNSHHSRFLLFNYQIEIHIQTCFLLISSQTPSPQQNLLRLSSSSRFVVVFEDPNSRQIPSA